MENLRTATREELIGIIEALMLRVAELEQEVRGLRAGTGGGTALAVKPSRPPFRLTGPGTAAYHVPAVVP